MIYELRNVRWLIDHLRAKTSGVAVVFDGRSKEGKAAKQMMRDAQAHLAQARDAVGTFLRTYGDEPLDDDLRPRK